MRAAAGAPSRAALITGGASGFGRALVEELAARGDCVLIADRDEERGAGLARRLGADGAAVRFLATDVTVPDDVEAAVEAAFSWAGRLDLMVNNAGIGVLGEVRDHELRHWQRVLDVNLRGVVHGVHAAYPRMVEQGFGHVVNVASLAGLAATPTGVAYAASKHAVVGLSLSLRAEAAPLGVGVSVACPGFVRTRFGDSAEYLGVRREQLFDSGNYEPERLRPVARAILRGVARNRAVILVPGWTRLAWWLARLSPSLWELLVGRAVVRRHRRLRDAGLSVGPEGGGSRGAAPARAPAPPPPARRQR